MTTIIKRLFSWLLALGLIFVVYKMTVMLRQPPSVEVAEIKQENIARALAITARAAAKIDPVEVLHQ